MYHWETQRRGQSDIKNRFSEARMIHRISWWRHQMETFSALLAICAGNSPVHGEFPTQRPVTRGFDVYFDMHPNKRLSKQTWGWWFETPSCPLWRHCNDIIRMYFHIPNNHANHKVVTYIVISVISNIHDFHQSIILLFIINVCDQLFVLWHLCMVTESNITGLWV